MFAPCANSPGFARSAYPILKWVWAKPTYLHLTHIKPPSKKAEALILRPFYHIYFSIALVLFFISKIIGGSKAS